MGRMLAVLAEEDLLAAGAEVGLMVAVGGTMDTGAVDWLPDVESENKKIVLVKKIII